MKEANLQLETLTCPSCMAKIESMLKRTPGIKESEVLFNSSRVRVKFDEAVVDTQAIKNSIGSLGFAVLSEK
ncbi:MAG: heavy-metal-associated domain-containing protein [Spirochaetota bacterium]